jgi:hypothetical protein
MNPSSDSNRGRPMLSTPALVTLLLVLGGLVVAAVAAAAPTAPPNNTGEPAISGRAEQGRTLQSSNGRWSGTQPISFAYQWVRCGPGGGRPDGGDCAIVSGATSRSYRLTAADVDFRMRIRVTASNADGSRTVASNPTDVVVGAPVNTSRPVVRGTMLVGQVITVDPGTWTGRSGISFSYQWLRCNTQGGECLAIGGATSRNYRLTSADVNRKMRVNVTARNSVGSATVMSGEAPTVSEPLPAGAIRLPSGEISIPASSVPSNHRLAVAQVVFSPNPVRSQRQVITVRVRAKDTRGFVVRDALVFVRSTPRVTTGGDRQLTTTDGWVTYQLAPNGNFPKPRRGYNVQFFMKVYRSGDPALGGVAGYRLVQVRLAA